MICLSYSSFSCRQHCPSVFFFSNGILANILVLFTKYAVFLVLFLLNSLWYLYKKKDDLRIVMLTMTSHFVNHFSSPVHEVQGELLWTQFVRRCLYLRLLTLYRLHFASNLHESLSENLSPSNLGQVWNWAIWGQKLGH